VDWIANYMETVEKYPVLAQVEPGAIRDHLPAAPPELGEPFPEIMRDVDEILMPGITHWQSPNFFAYFPANTSGPSMLGELLSAGLGVQGMLWATSPACTEIETHVLDWLVDMLALPDKFKSTGNGGGVIQDSASSATLCALLAARERATEFRSNTDGLPHRLTAYASVHAHSSVTKAMMIAGLGADNLRLIPADENQALRSSLLLEAINQDVAAGYRPFFVCGTVGTTAAGSVDPLAAIGRICAQHALWLHVDAAMAGTAAICDEFRFIHDGLDLADSYCFNPHKWMLVNFDCDCFYVAERTSLIRAMRVTPEYLENRATLTSEVIDYRDWQIPLGRRFRALKLWLVIRSYGVEQLRSLIREHVKLAREFAAWVDADPDFELAAPTVLNLVCFRHRGGDERNQRLLDDLNHSGRVFLTHAKIGGALALRMSIGQANTQRRHVEQAWELIRQAATAAAN